MMNVINGWILADRDIYDRVFAHPEFDPGKPETMFFPVFWCQEDAIKYRETVNPELWAKWKLRRENTIPVPIVIVLPARISGPDPRD